MNTQKQIAFTELKGKFTKDFDTFGKMDPFLEFFLGKSFGKTEIASSAGKQPVWKESVVLTYFDEPLIIVKAYDDDVTEKEFIGTGKLDIKSLKLPGGPIQIKFETDSGQYLGVVTGKYSIKNLPPIPLLLIKNIRLQLGSQQKSILKSKPFLRFSTPQISDDTEVKEQVTGLQVTWSQKPRLKIQQSSAITISLIDNGNKQDYLFKHKCDAKQFRRQNGIKRLNVFNKKFQKFAILHFQYQTFNLVSKEESAQNTDKELKGQKQLTAFSIEKISNQLKFQGKQIYFKLIIGSNSYNSQIFKKNQKVFSVQIKKTLYAQAKQNKLILVFISKDIIGESVIGFGNIKVDSLLTGSKKISLMNDAKEDLGFATLNLTQKTTPCKFMTIQNIALNLYEGGDLIGQSQPFIVGRIGSFSGSTQIGQANRLRFKKPIELKYVNEQFLEMQVWDSDLTKNELLYTEKVKISDLKNKGQHEIIYKGQSDGKVITKAKIAFIYSIVNHILQPPIPQPVVVEERPKLVVQEKPKPDVVEEKVQKQKPKEIQTKKVEEKQIKVEKKQQIKPTQMPIKKEQYPQRPLKTQQSKPQPPVKRSLKTEPNDTTQRPKKFAQNEEELNKSWKNINKTSLNNSNANLILPSISKGSKIFGDKIFEKQSSSTLQTSILAYSIPRAQRFSALPKYSGEPTYCIESCFKPGQTKGAGIGYGRKRQFPQWLERNMKDNPSPGAYNESKNDYNNRGPSFGLSYKYYQKVMIPKEMINLSKVQVNRKLSPIAQRRK